MVSEYNFHILKNTHFKTLNGSNFINLEFWKFWLSIEMAYLKIYY